MWSRKRFVNKVNVFGTCGRRRPVWLGGLALVLVAGCDLVAPGAAPAQQAAVLPRERELEILFEQLASAPDATSASEIEARIWTHWMTSGSATTDILMERGVLAEQEGDLVTARAFFDRAASLSPDYPEAWNRRAVIAFQQQEYGEALRDIEAVLRHEPRHFSALVGLGLVLEATGHPAAALRAFRDALLVHPWYAEAQRGVDRLAPAVEGRDV
jgi:tetratricopeptide (TPR) repeat protein